MNERIKELMVELKKTVSTHRGDAVLVGYDEIEKFAELIVKDVFAMVKEAMLEGDDSKTDEIIDDRLQDAASDVVDAYGIVDRIY